MLLKKVFTGLAIASLSAAAAYPHVNGYLRSLPQNMTKDQSGQRFMKIICPVNAINDQILVIDKKLKEEQSKSYPVGSDALANANVRVGALNNNSISLATRLKDAHVTASRQLTDPKYIWPSNVQKNVEAFADERFRLAGWINDKLNNRKTGEFKFEDYASSIRHKLSLPARGQGCPPVPTK